MITSVEERDFNTIYSEHKDKVWRLVSRYVAGTHDREDLFQEVFLAVHKALHKFRGDSAIGTWIYKIAVNTSINHIKRQKRYKWFTDLLSGFRQEESDDKEMIRQEKIFKPLEKLNPQQRMILLLSDVEEMKLDEIAKTLKLPVGTVKSNLHRARETVKKEVERNG